MQRIRQTKENKEVNIDADLLNLLKNEIRIQAKNIKSKDDANVVEIIKNNLELKIDDFQDEINRVEFERIESLENINHVNISIIFDKNIVKNNIDNLLNENIKIEQNKITVMNLESSSIKKLTNEIISNSYNTIKNHIQEKINIAASSEDLISVSGSIAYEKKQLLNKLNKEMDDRVSDIVIEKVNYSPGNKQNYNVKVFLVQNAVDFNLVVENFNYYSSQRMLETKEEIISIIDTINIPSNEFNNYFLPGNASQENIMNLLKENISKYIKYDNRLGPNNFYNQDKVDMIAKDISLNNSWTDLIQRIRIQNDENKNIVVKILFKKSIHDGYARQQSENIVFELNKETNEAIYIGSKENFFK